MKGSNSSGYLRLTLIGLPSAFKKACTDVPVQTVVDAVREYQPQVIGLSCLLTTCFDYMKKTIEAIREAGLDEGRLILIGGGPVDDATVKYVNADARCETAQVTVVKAKEFLEAK